MTNTDSFGIQKILKLFGAEVSRSAILKAELAGAIPEASRKETGAIKRRVWTSADLPHIGERYGFMKHPESSLCVAVFTTKGGVLKSTFALNLARTAALHNIRTCVVGLDMQCDITSALGVTAELENSEDFESAVEQLGQVRGLNDVFDGSAKLEDVIFQLDIPTLYAIAETPELVPLEQKINNKNRREYWLKEEIIAPLKEKFELVIVDCSPNWNRLITNALVACDVLVSPLECKINNFRNFTVFRNHLESFRKELKLNFDAVFIPSRFTSTRKLSAEIRSWYLANVPGCTAGVLRECTPSEEAMALHTSLVEYAPSSLPADEMRELLREVWSRCLRVASSKSAVKGAASTVGRSAATIAMNA
jgi:chromosome partitioning protein